MGSVDWAKAFADVESGEPRTALYAEYRTSDEWLKRRLAALKRACHRCQVCNRPKGLDVHHRTYERLGCENDSDLTVLCRQCHALFHLKTGLSKKRSKPLPSKKERPKSKPRQGIPVPQPKPSGPTRKASEADRAALRKEIARGLREKQRREWEELHPEVVAQRQRREKNERRRQRRRKTRA